MKKVVPVVGVAALAAAAFIYFGGDGFGFGKGDGNADSQNEAQVTTEATQNETVDTITIKVEEKVITVNGETIADVEALKSKICELDSKNENCKYVYEGKKAIKDVADDVCKALEDLQTSLGIKVEGLD